MAATHAEPDVRRRRAATAAGSRRTGLLNLVLAVGGGALDAAHHAGDDVAQQAADAEGAVLLALAVAGVPLLHADLLDDALNLRVVELLGQLSPLAVRGGGVDGVHEAREAGPGVDAHDAVGHPLAQLLGEVGHVAGVVPALGRALGKGARQGGEAPAVAVVGEEGLVGRGAHQDRGRGEVRRAVGRGVQPLERLLERLEGAGDGRRAQVQALGAVYARRQEPEPVDVEAAQAVAERRRRLPPLVREHAEVADGVDLALGAYRQHGGVVLAKGFEAALPRHGAEDVPLGVTLGGQDRGAEVADGIAVGPEGGKTGVGEAGGYGCSLTMAEEDLDQLELELGRVEGFELGIGVRFSGYERRHGLQVWPVFLC